MKHSNQSIMPFLMNLPCIYSQNTLKPAITQGHETDSNCLTFEKVKLGKPIQFVFKKEHKLCKRIKQYWYYYCPIK